MDSNYWTLKHVVNNGDPRPLRIKSGEYPDINNKLIQPNSGVMITVDVPFGFKPYHMTYTINDEPTIYIGYVDEDY